ncbi:MAG TPA: LLM class flavin-dependent oxidoreductase [Pseudolysinimonas sp.]|nr:LLM class flavin-dependent oxidoreductase [Pseudolysinimonas sp.]
MTQRQAILSLIVDLWGGMHPGAWRDENAPADPAMDLDRVIAMVKTAERGKFHTFFLADSLAWGIERDPEVVSRTSNVTRYEPFTLLSALAMVTEKIGLALTVSTTYTEPYNTARMLASLDYLSKGRAAWNIVTSNNEAEPNFNNYSLSREEKYERAAEFVEVARGLWDSLDDDALLRDKESGVFFDPAKSHFLNHVGKYFSVAGPFNIARPPQGHPIIAQAGASPAGLEFGTKNADVLFTYALDLEPAQAFYESVKKQVESQGRHRDDVKILSTLVLVLGRSQEEADARLAHLDSLADPQIGIERLKDIIGYDLTGYDLDGPVPEIPPTQTGSQSMQDAYLGPARAQNLTVRQLVQLAMRFDAVAMTPEAVADHIQERIETFAADGFNVTFGDAHGSLELFVDEVIPLLQERGVFHTDYEAATLRENLGLPRPVSRFAS